VFVFGAGQSAERNTAVEFLVLGGGVVERGVKFLLKGSPEVRGGLLGLFGGHFALDNFVVHAFPERSGAVVSEVEGKVLEIESRLVGGAVVAVGA
jgi:hypothetical protein